ACGLALQAYLRDSATDLSDMIDWSRKHGRRITVRLVKGAYWDYETVIAEQRHWPLPVFARKHETDANFEKLSLALLENQDVVDAAFGTHNVRSIAYVLAQADHMGIDRRNYEFQMLYGMADPVKLIQAVQQKRRKLGRRHPLIINGKTVSTSDWLPSLNPADQSEVIGYAAQAILAEADAALSAARDAQPKWARTPASERAAL